MRSRLALGLPLALGLLLLSGCGSGDENERGRSEDVAPRSRTLSDSGGLPKKLVRLTPITVRTNVPGCVLLVDGEPARTETGDLLRTPCLLDLPVGGRDLRVSKRGYDPDSQFVLVKDKPQDVTLTLDRAGEGDVQPTVVDQPWFDVPVGQPVALDAVNSSGRELDPYLEPGGLTLWFVSDRGGRKALYRADRMSVYEPFGAPVIVPESQGSGLPASPSVAYGEMQAVVYATPSTARLWSLGSEDFGDAGEKQILRYDESGNETWPSAQILGSGLELYWTTETRGVRKTWVSTRTAIDRQFVQAEQITLPGLHPCFSSDGLRHYLYDGRDLLRCDRGETKSGFGPPQVQQSLPLPNYRPDPSRKQISISEDQQWMVYCGDPTGRADLHLVRLSVGPGFGFAPIGKLLEPSGPEPEPEPVVMPDVDPNPTPVVDTTDPRTRPLPYAAFREQFTKLLRKGEDEAAVKLAREAANDPQLAAAREFISDHLRAAEAYGRLEGTLLPAMFDSLKPGTEIPFGPLKLKFLSYEGGQVTLEGRNDPIIKSIADFRPGDLLRMLDEHTEMSEEDSYAAGVWAFYRPDLPESEAEKRFAAAGKSGSEFLSAPERGDLFLARREMERDNAGAALLRLEDLLDTATDADRIAEAKELVQELYTATQWAEKGRAWDKPEPGAYHAGAGTQNLSFLQSPQTYENFKLRLEWKVAGDFGTGGVYFHYPGEGDPIDAAWKIQLAGDAGVTPDLYSTGSLFKIEAPSRNMAKPRGQWNTLDMTVRGRTCEASINGRKVLDTTLTEEDREATGYVLLDGEVGEVWYRKILLVELPSEAKPSGPVVKEPLLKE